MFSGSDEFDTNIFVAISPEKNDYIEGIEFVRSPKCGAISTFFGSVRDTDKKHGCNESQSIVALNYEAYETMAVKQIKQIARRIIAEIADTRTRSLCKIYISHRIGRVPVGEDAIQISVSSPSRDFSHTATMKLLREIKSHVPIWKSIEFSDGTREWPDSIRSEAFWINS